MLLVAHGRLLLQRVATVQPVPRPARYLGMRSSLCCPQAMGDLGLIKSRLAAGIGSSSSSARSSIASSSGPSGGPSAKRRRTLLSRGCKQRVEVVSANSPASVQVPSVAAVPTAAEPLSTPKAVDGQRLPGRARPAAAVAAVKAPEDLNALWMIIGLGNPGTNYDNTRHNIGFRVIEELAKADNIDIRKLEKGAAVGRGVLCGRQVLLVKPITFMNNSGEAAAALSKFYRVPPSRMLVVADDLDLPTATVRLRAKGGHGGHNGLRSITDRLGGTQDYPRLKIGIGRPPGQMPAADYVLQTFNRAEAPEVAVAVKEGADIIRAVLALGLEKALSGVRI